MPAMLERLRSVGVDVDIADVRRASDGAAATGRPHVADALVTLGVVPDRNTAFRLYLNPGRVAYVNRYAPTVVEMVRVVAEAGGVTVLAHPWGRHGPDAMPESAITELAGLGLAGLEVDHQDHTPADRERLRAVAEGLGLVVTGSSDHHGAGKFDHELGCNTTAPEHYERLVELAVATAARSGRTTPEVVT